MTSAEIDKAVLHFRKEYGLKSVDYKSLFNAAEKLGYTVIEYGGTVGNPNVKKLITALNLEAETQQSTGFAYARGTYRLVFINGALSDKEKTIVLSHEIGHIVLGHLAHRYIAGQDVQDEFEANEFSNFLLKSDNKLFVIFTCYKAAAIAAAAAILLLTAAVILLTSPGIAAAVFGGSSANKANELSLSDLAEQYAQPSEAAAETTSEGVTEPSTEQAAQAPSEQPAQTTSAELPTVYVPVPVIGQQGAPVTENAAPAAAAPHTTKPAAAQPQTTKPQTTTPQTTKPQTTTPQTTKPKTTKPPTTKPHTPEDDFGSSALYSQIKAEMAAKYTDFSNETSYDSDKHQMTVTLTMKDGVYGKIWYHYLDTLKWWYPIADGAIADTTEIHNRIAEHGLNVDFCIRIIAYTGPDEYPPNDCMCIFEAVNGKVNCYMENQYRLDHLDENYNLVR